MSDRTYLAWELCGDWWWANQGFLAVIVGGRTRYELANASKTQRTVCLSYINAYGNVTLRYVHPDTPMKLVRL